jgi:aminopeptidase
VHLISPHLLGFASGGAGGWRDPVRDPRVTALAQILVRHSTQVAEGDVCTIEGESGAEPLLQAVYEEVLKAGGNPIVHMAMAGQSASYFEHASDRQLDWISPVAEWAVENADVRIAVMASENTRALSKVPPERQARRQAATQELMKRAMERSAEGEYRWALTLFPTHAYASEAGLSLAAYEDFYYGACLATDSDPVGAWKRQSEETERLADWIQGRSEVHVTGEGTDLRLGIEDRNFIPAGGTHNMPDGEFFTGPIEDSAEGEIFFHLPATYAGREVSGVRFRFQGGKVVDASAEKGEGFLVEMLDTDEGARRLGELGIGTNYGISEGTGEILLDEKIGGTVHLAVGRSYPETGGVNESAIHWDMICDLRRGGQIEVDGEPLQRDGQFVV